MLALNGKPSRKSHLPFGTTTCGDAEFIRRNVEYLLSTGADSVLVATVRHRNRRSDLEKVWNILPNRRKHLEFSGGSRVSFDGNGEAYIDEQVADYKRMTSFGWIVIAAFYPEVKS